jgi:hypothetical protein
MSVCSVHGVIQPLCSSKDKGKSVKAVYGFHGVFLALRRGGVQPPP